MSEAAGVKRVSDTKRMLRKYNLWQSVRRGPRRHTFTPF